ncbi:MAG: nucleotide exchange factor GrpE [Caldilineaceae bacterium]|nr:nucleotide exchange factor GrpE [Caldilineaceae bacterium]
MPVYYNDPFRRRGTQPRSSSIPGIPDNLREAIQRLMQENQAFQAKSEQQAQVLEAKQRELDAKQREVEALQRELAAQAPMLAETRRELQIKDEALRRQSADLKQMEAELVFARGGLQQQEKEEESKNSPEEMSWRERYVRLQAELDNLRRRWEQRFETETTSARQDILRDMLPLADHLEMALEHGAATEDEQAKEYLSNISATLQAFLHTLKRYGVTPIEAQGKPFDPNLHEAVGQVQTGDMPSGHVAHVTQTGYMEGDKLLRPARVLVRE